VIKISSFMDDRSPLLSKLLAKVSGLRVYVGIPEEKTGRKGEEVGNAALMYIHTHGSMLRGIPSRPVIEPAISAKGNKEKIEDQLAAAARAAMDGNDVLAKRSLKLAGMLGQNAARGWFTDPRNGWAPNTEATIAAKGSDKPLIDTGQLRKAIIYVVKE
jgi:hypothetical protein